MPWELGLLNQRWGGGGESVNFSCNISVLNKLFAAKHHWRKLPALPTGPSSSPQLHGPFFPFAPIPFPINPGSVAFSQLHLELLMGFFMFHWPGLLAPRTQHTSICAGSGKSSDHDYSLLGLIYTLITHQQPSLSRWLELALHLGWTLPNSLATDKVLTLNDSAIKGREIISEKGVAQFDSKKPALIWCPCKSCA